ncbi:peptide ligase PGM1-related protein [Streptomyces virginiae]|nr:peptide ligase PGM1-related protein [Streptomyces virginiae]
MRASRLAFDPERGEGVVVYADADAVIARRAGDVEEQEAALAEVLEFEEG